VSVDFVPRNNWFYFNIKANTKKESLLSSTDLTTALLAAFTKITTVVNEINHFCPLDVSVVIPVHNREKLILKCINSLNNQTINKDRFEVIFVDDCSSDKSIAAIEYNIAPDINYRIIRREIGSGNASTPRNEGIKAAKGRYIFFMDSDDYIDETLLERGVHIADKNNSDIVYFKIASDGNREVPIRPYKVKIVDKADITKHHLLRSLTIFKFFRRNMLKEHNILFNPAITVAEDKIFMVQSLSVANNISILADKDYYHLTFHGNGHLSRQKFPLEDRHFILNSVINTIYFCGKTNEEKAKLYNAWLVICLEMMEKVCGKAGGNEQKKRMFFNMLSTTFNIRSDLVNQDMIYTPQRKFIKPFLQNNYEGFIAEI
ncbi:glycosyltransferase family 2 protein, partial [Escherichia coli]|nr:glycosyltransferase family 2 protein [Escherichia coli]MED0270245.1 glycosyltransferase family 2 protein [Escherichia coli]